MIGIIGGGITGLTIHHQLRQHGLESIVFEAGAEPGGVIRTSHKDGHILEHGPQRTRLTQDIRSLVGDIGLTDRIVKAQSLPVYIYHAGKLRRAPLTMRDALWTDLLSVKGKLRALLEPLTESPQDGETVEEYLSRAFGTEFATRVGGPLYAGLYASDPRKMPVEYSLKRALDRFEINGSILLSILRTRLSNQSPPPVISFRSGMQELPQALYAKHSDTIRLNTPITGIHEHRNGFRLSTARSTSLVDKVVLTTPAPTARDLLMEIDPDSASALGSLNYNPLVIVHLRAQTTHVGFGHKIPFRDPHVTLGVTWNNCLFSRNENMQQVTANEHPPDVGRAGIYTCYLGGAKTPEAIEWPDEQLMAVAEREFTEVTGASAEPLGVYRLKPGMPAYDYSWNSLNQVNPPSGIQLCGNFESRAGIPGRVRRGKQLADAIITSARDSGPLAVSRDGRVPT